jgi:3-hydroxyisobutyrate dehydrogenase-like beta-hydroxyacid dehydrogenase
MSTQVQSAPVGFIGLGAMGRHMAARLLDAGHHVAVYDTQDVAMVPLVRRGAVACDSPRAVADLATTVLVSLPSPDVVRTVATGADGIVHGDAVRTYVDLSTTGPQVAAEVGQALERAAKSVVDAPVSGGVSGAEKGTLTLMVAAHDDVMNEVRPLLEAMGSKIFHVGPSPGMGQLAKVINNLLSGAALAITGEAMALGVKGGLDPATLLDVFNASSGRNSATLDKFPRAVLQRTFDFGFTTHLMNKDVQLCLQEAERHGVPMPLGSITGEVWARATSQSAPTDDCTEIVKLIEDAAGTVIGAPVTA